MCHAVIEDSRPIEIVAVPRAGNESSGENSINFTGGNCNIVKDDPDALGTIGTIEGS